MSSSVINYYEKFCVCKLTINTTPMKDKTYSWVASGTTKVYDYDTFIVEKAKADCPIQGCRIL